VTLLALEPAEEIDAACVNVVVDGPLETVVIAKRDTEDDDAAGEDDTVWEDIRLTVVEDNKVIGLTWAVVLGAADNELDTPTGIVAVVRLAPELETSVLPEGDRLGDCESEDEPPLLAIEED
jgi:hypothetical protein